MSSKKKTKSTSQTILDPLTQQLSEMRVAQEKRMDPLRALSVDVLKNVLQPGNLASSPFDESSLAFSSPEERAAYERYKGLTDISKLEKAAGDTLSTIVAPELQAQLTAAGLGRSGAVGEALAKEGTRMALPLAAEARAASGGLANWLSGIAGRRQDLAGNLADPSRMLFAQAPTQINTTTTKTSGVGSWLPQTLGTIGSLYSGGAFGSMGSALSGIGSKVGGFFGMGGGSPFGGPISSFGYQASPYGLSGNPFARPYSLFG